MTLTWHHSLLDAVRTLAREAGRAILDIYHGDFAVTAKADDSPLTAADQAAEAVILAGLARLTPDLPVVAEESVAAGHMPDIRRGLFWLVDPLDGTREFVKRNGEFTVNIGLVESGRPVLGVVFAPAIDRLYAAAGPGTAIVEAEGVVRGIHVRSPRPEGLVVMTSRSHGDDAALEAYLAPMRVAECIKAGSSLKFCIVAAGEADLYPRLGHTMEWDTAAGHAVLLAAGGSVRTLDGLDLTYGKPGLHNPDFVAAGQEMGHHGP
ncbi:MAG: 3'(2'),5'-bisphosphate nucleotidase CysQ [Alphaproteobacteria bacterium]